MDWAVWVSGFLAGWAVTQAWVPRFRAWRRRRYAERNSTTWSCRRCSFQATLFAVGGSGVTAQMLAELDEIIRAHMPTHGGT